MTRTIRFPSELSRPRRGAASEGCRLFPLLRLLLLMYLLDSPLSVLAQSTNPPGPSNRWLFVVETSRAMQGRAGAAREITAGLVGAGVNGQLLPGDTLGLWTFNDALYAGDFPLQDITTPGSLQLVGRRVLEHLRKQQFANAARLDRVMPQLLRLARDSEFLTVVLVTEGSSPIRGTPFDVEINGRFEAWKNQQATGGMPFVTVLRAKNGVLTDFVVNTPPFPLEMPPLPEELSMPRTAKPAPVVEIEKPPARPMAAPLILSGRKPEPPTQSVAEVTEPVVRETAPPAQTNPVQAKIERPTTAVTNVSVPVRPPVTPDTTVMANSASNRIAAAAPRIRTNVQAGPSTEVIVFAKEAGTNGVKGVQGSSSSTPLAAAASDAGSTRLLVAASIGMTLGVVLFLLLRWRAAQRHQASLITRSLDRDSH